MRLLWIDRQKECSGSNIDNKIRDRAKGHPEFVINAVPKIKGEQSEVREEITVSIYYVIK